jgi:hypothetical protein
VGLLTHRARESPRGGGTGHLDDATAEQGDEVLVGQLGQQGVPRHSIEQPGRAFGVGLASRARPGGQQHELLLRA